MGRAMLIIVAGVLISLGITQTSVFGGLENFVQHSGNIAENVQAKNVAYMGTELAIQNMIQDPSWRDGESATFDIDSGSSSVTIEEISTNEYRLISTGTFNGEVQTITMVLQEGSSSSVPTFKSALGLLFEEEGLFTGGIAGGGNKGGVDGNDASSTCASVPGVLVPGNNDKSLLEGIDSQRNNMDLFRGDPGVSADPNLNFDEVAKLIEALEASNPTYLPTNGDDIDDLGSPDNPGVFFVENGKAKVAGGTEGYGIMVVKSTGEVDTEAAELTLSGNVEFNGLVIFENAYNLTNNGTVDIFGSVLVGKTMEGADFDFQFNGNARIQYDCSAQKYADQAASSSLSSNIAFQQMSVYEN